MDDSDESLPLSRRAQRRAYLLNQLLSGEVTTGEAAALPGLSERHVKRLRAAYRRDGLAALVHGNAGRVPWHALPAEIRVRIQELARDRYAGLNYRNLSEKLAHDVGIELHLTTVARCCWRPECVAQAPVAHRRIAVDATGWRARGSCCKRMGPGIDG
jgi:hypothetical protein